MVEMSCIYIIKGHRSHQAVPIVITVQEPQHRYQHIVIVVGVKRDSPKGRPSAGSTPRTKCFEQVYWHSGYLIVLYIQ